MNNETIEIRDGDWIYEAEKDASGNVHYTTDEGEVTINKHGIKTIHLLDGDILVYDDHAFNNMTCDLSEEDFKAQTDNPYGGIYGCDGVWICPSVSTATQQYDTYMENQLKRWAAGKRSTSVRKLLQQLLEEK
jgi:hypothetical protein